MMQCLTDIIGITQTDCQCVISGLQPAEIQALRVSTSGLYLDDLPGGVHMKALTRVDACRNMSQMALGARASAIKTLEDDLVVALNQRYKKDRPNFLGQIGRMSYAQSLGVMRPIQALWLRPNDYTDGVVKINRIHIILNQAVAITVRLLRAPLDSVVGQEIASWPVTTAANGYTVVTETAISLPLVYENEMVEYYLTYDISEPGTPAQPKDTGIKCGTCDKNIAPFSNYITVKGVQLNSVSTLNDKLTDDYSHGLILDVEIKCDSEKLFCGQYQANDAIAVTMANAVRFKTGELLIEDVLKQPDVNRYTTMDRTYLWGKRNHFRAEYENRIIYLGATIDVTASNCYVCRNSPNQPFMAPILI